MHRTASAVSTFNGFNMPESGRVRKACDGLIKLAKETLYSLSSLSIARACLRVTGIAVFIDIKVGT